MTGILSKEPMQTSGTRYYNPATGAETAPPTEGGESVQTPMTMLNKAADVARGKVAPPPSGGRNTAQGTGEVSSEGPASETADVVNKEPPEVTVAKKQFADAAAARDQAERNLKDNLKKYQLEIPKSQEEIDAGVSADKYEKDTQTAEKGLTGLGEQAKGLGNQAIIGQAISQIAEGITKAFAAAHGATNVDVKGLNWNEVHRADVEGLNMQSEAYKQTLMNKRDLMNKALTEQSRLTNMRENREYRNQESYARMASEGQLRLDMLKARAEEKEAATNMLKGANMNQMIRTVTADGNQFNKDITEGKNFLQNKLPAALASYKSGVSDTGTQQLIAHAGFPSDTQESAELVRNAATNQIAYKEFYRNAKLKVAEELAKDPHSRNDSVVNINNRIEELPGTLSTSIPSGKVGINTNVNAGIQLSNLAAQPKQGEQLRADLHKLADTTDWGFLHSDESKIAKKVLAGQTVTKEEAALLGAKGIKPWNYFGIKDEEYKSLLGKLAKDNTIDYTSLTSEQKSFLAATYTPGSIAYGIRGEGEGKVAAPEVSKQTTTKTTKKEQ